MINIAGRVMTIGDGLILPHTLHIYEAKDKVPVKSHSHVVFLLFCTS